LEYRFCAMALKDHVMLHSDLKSEEDISVFAALEFKGYGQPLDNYPQLFALASEAAKSVVSNFVQEYRRSIPTTAEYAVTLGQFAESGNLLVLLAHTAVMASKRAGGVRKASRA
jgi:hypothetical protein